MALPVMAGLSAGQAQAQEQDPSLFAQQPTGAIQMDESLDTQGASNLFMQAYEPEASQILAERMEASMGGEASAFVMNWDGIELSDYSKAELQQLHHELSNLHFAEFSDTNAFSTYHEIAERGDFNDDPRTKEELIKTLKNDYINSSLTPKFSDGHRVAISSYGQHSHTNTVSLLTTPEVSKSNADLNDMNAFHDDYVKRHENCHGLDKDIYGEQAITHNTEDLTVKFSNGQGELPLKDHYRMYMTEQFADTCTTLEYALEGNTEALEQMEMIASMRDAGSLVSVGKVTGNDTVSYTRDIGGSADQLEFLAAVQANHYIVHHDTGPSIRAMLDYTDRLPDHIKAELASDPVAFEEFVRDVIEKSAMSPDEYAELTQDMLTLSHSPDAELSPQMQDLLDRGYEGVKTTVEYNLDIPHGSINALNEAAPEATLAMTSASMSDYNAYGENTTMSLVMTPSPESISQFPSSQRVAIGKMYVDALNIDIQNKTGMASPELQNAYHIEPTTDLGSFYATHVSAIAKEAGKDFSRIGSASFDKDTFEIENSQETQRDFEVAENSR